MAKGMQYLDHLSAILIHLRGIKGDVIVLRKKAKGKRRRPSPFSSQASQIVRRGIRARAIEDPILGRPRARLTFSRKLTNGRPEQVFALGKRLFRCLSRPRRFALVPTGTLRDRRLLKAASETPAFLRAGNATTDSSDWAPLFAHYDCEPIKWQGCERHCPRTPTPACQHHGLELGPA